jgi:hypothetical protein
VASAGSVATGALAPHAASSAPGPYPVSAGPQATGSRSGYVFGPQSQPTAALDQSGGAISHEPTAEPGAIADKSTASEGPSLERLAAAERTLLAKDGTNPVLVGSLILLVIGLALFGLRFAARRVR